MRYKKGLALILFVLLFGSAAYGNGTANKVNLSGPVVFADEVYDTAVYGQPFFLISNIKLNEGHTGSIVAIFSTVAVKGRVTGNVISINSTVTADGGVDGFFFEPPRVLIKFILSILRILSLLIIVSFNKSFFEQGFGVCANDVKGLFKVGLTVYFFALAMCLIFIFAVFTYPLTLLIIVLAAAAVVCGEVSVGMYLGYVLLSKSGLRFARLNGLPFNSFANIVAGGIIIECFSFIPYIGLVYSFFFLPVVCIGVLFLDLLNAVLYKKFYTLPYIETEAAVNGIRDILTEGLE